MPARPGPTVQGQSRGTAPAQVAAIRPPSASSFCGRSVRCVRRGIIAFGKEHRFVDRLQCAKRKLRRCLRTRRLAIRRSASASAAPTAHATTRPAAAPHRPRPSNPSPFLVARTELGVCRRAGLLAGALLAQPQAAARCEPRLVRLVASQTDRRLSNLFEQDTVMFLRVAALAGRPARPAGCWQWPVETRLGRGARRV